MVRVCALLSQDEKSFQNLLCGQKKSFKAASPAEMALVEGISLKKARLIQQFIQENNIELIDDIQRMKGIGKKTMIKIKQYFY